MAGDELGEHIGNLQEQLSQIETPGIFLAGLKDSNAASPALVVQGLGHLSVPITPEQSSQLQALCSPDPSRLEGAAGDPEKHPAWQLSPSLFQCSNPGWAAYVKTQARKLLKKMGVPSDTIIYPDIQKLVLYQHTWRAPTVQSADTAAVMVIILPSQFKGGALQVYDWELHLCKERDLEPDAYTTSCMAFLKGFEYELQDVEGGGKLALIYHLVQRSAGPLPVFQDIDGIISQVERDFEAWEAEKLLPKRAFYILDNEYDYYGGLRAGVSDLVGRDHAVAHALVQTYSTTSIEIHLAFVSKEQSGTEVTWTADRWQYIGGSLLPLKSVKIYVEEIMQGQDCFAGREPYDEDGSSRKWRQAALVLWPRCHSYHLLCDSGQDSAVSMLSHLACYGTAPRRRLSKAAAQLMASGADELASAMAAAAEDTLPEAGQVEDASRFAAVVWDRFSLNLLNARHMPQEKFVHLIHELRAEEVAMKIADNLKETEKQFQVRRSAQIRQQLFNKPTHGVIYPEDAYVHTSHRKLDLTPSSARELVLLADLVGWMVFVPILLDMASRPDDCSFMNCNYSWRQSRDLDRVWGGFEALKILTKKACGPSSQPLVQILPAMAVAVAQGAFTKGSKLFDARKEHVCDTKLHIVRQHFIKDIAYTISDLAVLVTEEGKSELKALHDRFVELYMQQPYKVSSDFFRATMMPACRAMASCSSGRAKLAVCPILQSLVRACIARLEELTKDVPQKPKDWACDAKLQCRPKDSTSEADGLCVVCQRYQAFLRDGSRNVFTASMDEVYHLSCARQQVVGFEYDVAINEGTVTYTQKHRTYDLAAKAYKGYLSGIAMLKKSMVN